MTTLWEIECEFINLITEMKRTGIKIDKQFSYRKAIKGEEICRLIKNDLGWNPGSPKQIGKFLLEEMGYPVLRRTDNGNPSFDKHALEEYELMLEADGSDVAQKILRYRGYQKTTSSNYRAYLKLADRNGILHPNYKIHGTVTGRLSCEMPNLQQIPRTSDKEWNGDLKQGFISRNELLRLWYELYGYRYPDLEETVLVEFDYGQLETRLAAAVAGEQELLEAFKAGIDVFQVMADRLNWDRQDAKLFNYMTLYGAGPNKIKLVFNVPYEVAKDMRAEFYGAYPGFKTMAARAQGIAQRQKYITLWTGRRRHFGRNNPEYHKAWNSAIQGGAYEIVKRSGIRLRKTIHYPMVLTVHDSYVLELPRSQFTENNLEQIKQVLEDVPEAEQMGVPFAVEYKIWGSK